MKRINSFAVFVTIVLLFASAVSAAQQTFKRGNTIGGALDFVVACAGLKGLNYEMGADIVNQKLAVDVTVDACSNWTDMSKALTSILPDLYNFVVDNEGILHIKRAVFPPSSTPAASTQTSQPIAPTTSAQTMSSEDLRRQPLAPPLPPLPHTYSAVSPTEEIRNRPLLGSYDTRFGGWSDRYDPYYEAQRRRVEGAATTGWFKLYTDGDKDFSTHLVVLRRIGDTYVAACAGGKAFRIVHDGCEIPIGIWTFKFELREGGRTRFYEENVEILSKYTAKNPVQYPISREMFESWQNAEGMKRVETWKPPAN